MASNIKALSGLLKNKLLTLAVKSLPQEDLKTIFLQKDNDTADILKDRTIYAFQKGIGSTESNLRKNADIIKYLTENNLHEVYTDAAELLIDKKKSANGKEILTGYFSNPAPKAKLTENPGIKMQMDFLLQKSDVQNLLGELHKEIEVMKKGQDPKKIKELMMKLDNLDKLLGQNFSNVTASINLADKVDNLRVEISTMIIRARIRLIEKSKADRKVKQTEFTALMQGYKDGLQKKQAFFQSRLQKVSEIIQNLQSKAIVNIGKLKNVDLSKSIQLYLKFNNEIIKLDETLQELFRSYSRAASKDKETIAKNIINQQRSMIDKISRLDQFTNILNTKTPPPVMKDVYELMVFYEEFYYLQTMINHFKRFLQEETDDLSSIFAQLRNREALARNPFLYRADKMSYRAVRTYLENSIAESNSAVLYLDARAGVGASIYVLPDNISFYGLVKAEVKINAGKAIEITFSGYSGYRADGIVGTEEIAAITNLKTKVSFIFIDFDDVSKCILSGFKKFDLFNRLQNIKPLVQV
jgi:hypothetical protein